MTVTAIRQYHSFSDGNVFIGGESASLRSGGGVEAGMDVNEEDDDISDTSDMMVSGDKNLESSG
jgi:hypothetical protein